MKARLILSYYVMKAAWRYLSEIWNPIIAFLLILVFCNTVTLLFHLIIKLDIFLINLI